MTWHTGDLHTHDVVLAKAQGDNLSLGDGSGEKPAKAGTPTKEQVPGGADVLLVNTRFSCLARLTAEFNFAPVWKPKFVSDIVPEDRCHLNGLALRDGRPKYVTALGTTDEPGRGARTRPPAVWSSISIPDEVVAGGLSMPHSPRWYGDALWVLNSGTGELLAIDPATGEVRVVCACRVICADCPWSDLRASGDVPDPREAHFRRPADPDAVRPASLRRCRGRFAQRTQVGCFEFTAGCEELYDVQFLPGVHRPMILNLEKPVVRQAMVTPGPSYWLRPSSEIPLAGATGTLGEDAGVKPDEAKNRWLQ